MCARSCPADMVSAAAAAPESLICQNLWIFSSNLETGVKPEDRGVNVNFGRCVMETGGTDGVVGVAAVNGDVNGPEKTLLPRRMWAARE